MKSSGLQHAASLGNIEVFTQNRHVHVSGRSYDSEDENMGRKKDRTASSVQCPKASVYSIGDIREQYCLSDRQLSSIEGPRRDGFFGCLSGRGAPQSLLGVCVGRRAPSDENLADYAPFYRYPRYPNQTDASKLYDDDVESSYFRRRPTSFISTGDAKRYTWMPADEDAVRLEGARSICPDDFDNRGPYIVGSYQPSSYLSQSSEHLAGVYRCPAHVGLPPPPPPPVMTAEGAAPRAKHVSFARSHTLTSFDEAVGRSTFRMNTRNQERLIGGKKTLPPAITQTILQQQPSIIHQPLASVTSAPEIVVVEKMKRLTMKAQATQTEVCLGKKARPTQHLSLSPRTILRVKMVSQGAQTNGGLNVRKLTKSLSEMTNARNLNIHCTESGIQTEDLKMPCEHETLHRTQSEEPPRSPFELHQHNSKQSNYYQFEVPSRTSSQQSETDRSSQNIFNHSRNLSQDSANSYKSIDTSISRASHELSSMNIISESGPTPSYSRGSIVEANSPNEFDQCYETNSLPRQKCIHHKAEFHTYSLPRKDPHQHNYSNYSHSQVTYAGIINGTLSQQNQKKSSISRDSSIESNHPEPNERPLSCGTTENIVTYKRPSYPSDLSDNQTRTRRASAGPYPTEDVNSVSDEFCSTCESESDSRQEHEMEILIDFKPILSNNSSPRSRKKRLQKTLSEGEILFDNRKNVGDGIKLASASQEELQTSDAHGASNYLYRNAPIKDEGICDKNNLLKLPGDRTDSTLRNKREAFRKRSISLEESCNNDVYENLATPVKSQPTSPGLDELSVKNHSTYPSTDSLTNDATRDHSDEIWNESQATVLQAEPTAQGSVPSLLTPTAKRKHLLLQHQQRSSMDTDALELEDHFSDQSVPPSAYATKQNTTIAQIAPTIKTTISQVTPTSMPSIAVTPSVSIGIDDHKVPIQSSIRMKTTTIKTSSSQVTPTSMPSIAVTTSLSSEINDNKAPIQSSIHRKSRPSSPSKRKEMRKCSAFGQDMEPTLHTYSSGTIESPEHTRTSPTPEIWLNRTDSGKTNTDLSECSTNTEDYVTCTDNSKRTAGIKPASASSSSTTQVPASAQTSQTFTQDGSSFESASSIYSLARVDAICEDGGVLDDTIPLPPIPSQNTVKSSPSHSVASSSSAGSYCPNGLKRPKTTSSQTNIVKPIQLTKPKTESVSDDDKSEKRYSSSGYYESPQDEDNKPSRQRRVRDWNEEERRRRKEKMRLDIEKENMKSLTSPMNKSTAAFKQISPDDRTAMNILDGTSPNKTKRLRPKTRRSPRVRNSNDEFVTKRVKTPIVISPEINVPDSVTNIGPSTSKYRLSPRKSKDSSSEKGLKALSTESLRSGSPGSDSVFYSEADAMLDNQVHCHNCGKQVEIITAASGSQETLGGSTEEIVATIVKPPADFADSPDGPRTPHHSTRLYKKLDKRFRSEDRHVDKRLYRSRQESARAKSEERGKDETIRKATLRPAGSSPCVVVTDQLTDPEFGMYHGFYKLANWICINVNNRDVWKKHDFGATDERRGSTESEKEFRRKYHVMSQRLVHRKSCAEMYRRQCSNSFYMISSSASPNSLRSKLEEIFKLMLVVWAKEGIALKTISGQKSASDKTIVLEKNAREFGIRIHSSKPVIVSRIEPETPAETSGLEVGDIVLSINGVSVIDKTHSEVVEIASGSDTLELEVATTLNLLSSDIAEPASSALYSGYLWRQGGQSTNNHNWVRRWFCMRADNCLYYFKSDVDVNPIGAILLTNHSIDNCSSDIGRPFAFRILSEKGLPLYLAADTEEAANRWVAVTRHAANQNDPWLEICDKNFKLPPNGVPRPDCFGYLMKLGHRWRAWSSRYCVLKDACLYFYHNGNSKSAFGMACLQGYRVVPPSTSYVKKHVFEIAPLEPRFRHYCFSTESEMDKKRWIAALEYSIDRWIKAG